MEEGDQRHGRGAVQGREKRDGEPSTEFSVSRSTDLGDADPPGRGERVAVDDHVALA